MSSNLKVYLYFECSVQVQIQQQLQSIIRLLFIGLEKIYLIPQPNPSICLLPPPNIQHKLQHTIITPKTHPSPMNSTSFYQLVLKEITKTNMKRMNLNAFTRLMRSRVQQLSTSQLMHLYCHLQRLKSINTQFHPQNTHTYPTGPFKSNTSKPIMKYESYQKHILICLEDIAMKLKEKNGFEEGVDLCKLFYLRLLNLIDYHLPYLHVLQQFRGEFVWRDLGEEVIDYVALVEKDPANFCAQYVETVKLIVQQVSEELENIDILQLPYLKSVLSKGQKYQSYGITDQLLERVDSIICENRFAFSFSQLQKSLVSDHKNRQLLEYYALMNKDLTEKRLNYLFLDSLNDKLSGYRQSESLTDVKKQVGLPGKPISQDSIGQTLKKLSDLSLYGTYINIFASVLQTNQLQTIPLAKQYIAYHYKYFSKSGNVHCDIRQICQVLSNTLKNEQGSKQKGIIRLRHLQVLKLFFVVQMLLRTKINGKSLAESHYCLSEELQILSDIQIPKVQNLNKIFDKSVQYFISSPNLDQSKPLIALLTDFVESSDEKVLSSMIQEELQSFDPSQKTFLMNELIICLISNTQDAQLRDFSKVSAKLLEILMKVQFKKFSTEASNIQKILSLVKAFSNSVTQRDSSKNEEKNTAGKKQSFKSLVV